MCESRGPRVDGERRHLPAPSFRRPLSGPAIIVSSVGHAAFFATALGTWMGLADGGRSVDEVAATRTVER